MLALLGGNGEEALSWESRRFSEQWEGWNIKAGLQMRISGTTGNVPLQPREYLQGQEWMDQNTHANLQSEMSLPGPRSQHQEHK